MFNKELKLTNLTNQPKSMKRLSRENYISFEGIKEKIKVTLLVYLMLSLSLYAKDEKKSGLRKANVAFHNKSNIKKSTCV